MRGAALDMDSCLMVRVRSGCMASFGMLLNRHRWPVTRFLWRMIRNQAIAEELAQEAFLRVYRSRESYEPTARFTTWLFRIATHLALNWLRDERHTQGQESLDESVSGAPVRQVPDRTPGIEAHLIARVRQAEIRRAILHLPSKQRAAVLMHKYQELDYTQIAGALGCSESAVKSLLFRAYECLRSRLAQYAC